MITYLTTRKNNNNVINHFSIASKAFPKLKYPNMNNAPSSLHAEHSIDLKIYYIGDNFHILCTAQYYMHMVYSKLTAYYFWYIQDTFGVHCLLSYRQIYLGA